MAVSRQFVRSSLDNHDGSLCSTRLTIYIIRSRNQSQAEPRARRFRMSPFRD